MTYLASNLKVLRKRHKLTQQMVADNVGCKRSSYSGWENGAADPNVEMLIILATKYSITVDRLLKLDLRSLTSFAMDQLERGEDKLNYLPTCIRPINTTH